MPIDRSILEAALVGYTSESQRIEEKMAEIRLLLGRRANGAIALTSESRVAHRRFSASAKKRIAAAQRKRWAAYHKEHGRQKAKAKVKGKMSPAHRAKLVAALAKARAAKAAKSA